MTTIKDKINIKNFFLMIAFVTLLNIIIFIACSNEIYPIFVTTGCLVLAWYLGGKFKW